MCDMKIKNISEPKKFFEVLEQCKGNVELVTSEGDRLNLKSTLCQYIALTQMFKDAKIDEVELIVSEPEDLNLLLNYLVRK
ncbi:MAG: polya polymerase [Eubacteriales bacterium]